MTEISEMPSLALEYRGRWEVDAEIMALAGLTALLAPLDRESALRVLRWATDRCLKPPIEPR